MNGDMVISTPMTEEEKEALQGDIQKIVDDGEKKREAEVREILKGFLDARGNLTNCRDQFVWWLRGRGHAVLDGSFSVEELEAMAWWMKKNC